MASRKRRGLSTQEVLAAATADSDDSSFEEDDSDRESDALSDHEPEHNNVVTDVQDPAAVVDSDVEPAVCDDDAGRDSDENTIIYDYHSDDDSDSDNGTDTRDISVKLVCLNLRCVSHRATKYTTPWKTTDI